ncbi:MAG: hypothetical protein JWM34_2720 [Ilumatobacteraceae bacterium]|nr:hypothetical protein [Ilumatobacteraceae bacterium]
MSREEWTALMQGIEQQVAEIATRTATKSRVDSSLLDAWAAPAFADLHSIEPLRQLGEVYEGSLRRLTAVGAA